MSEREISCLNCGKKVIDRGVRQNKQFCCKNCQSGYWLRMKKATENETPCIYNDGVVFVDHQCDNCGWNPAVAKEREEKILYGN